MGSSDDEEDLSILGQIKSTAKMEGYNPGTADFERRTNQLRVVQCREMRGMSTCSTCIAFDHCELIKIVMRASRGYDE